MPDTNDANARRESATPEVSQPFFARFLEGQKSEEGVPQAVTERHMTLKYPSDRDEIDWCFDS
jgi:hypothetical protein